MCLTHRCIRVTTTWECTAAAKALGFSGKSVTSDFQTKTSNPPGCFHEYTTNTLWVNKGGNTGPCTDWDRCLCKKAESTGAWCQWSHRRPCTFSRQHQLVQRTSVLNPSTPQVSHAASVRLNARACRV